MDGEEKLDKAMIMIDEIADSIDSTSDSLEILRNQLNVMCELVPRISTEIKYLKGRVYKLEQKNKY